MSKSKSKKQMQKDQEIEKLNEILNTVAYNQKQIALALSPYAGDYEKTRDNIFEARNEAAKIKSEKIEIENQVNRIINMLGLISASLIPFAIWCLLKVCVFLATGK